ncbi:MAG: 16S rRNA (cytosine(1402)-N(4))-methyltransferase RsmH [Acidimicrobiales bacterium]
MQPTTSPSIAPASQLHRPVMLSEVVALLGAVPPGLVVDATVGLGGHAEALLGAAEHLEVLGLDQDDRALEHARTRLAPFGDRFSIRRCRFDQMDSVVVPPAQVSGVLFDLGVSSIQLDQADRGFSYRLEGPLDMRMDDRRARTAADVVNQYDPTDLSRVLTRGGQARYARRIAGAIVAARPIGSTRALAEVIASAFPAAERRRPGHPARVSFQALRMEVNEESTALAAGLDQALGLLAPGGRVVVMSYHSGEDALVKARLGTACGLDCRCPVELGCACGAAEAGFRLLWRGVRRPSATEVAVNPRAESARMRAVERLAAS